MNAEWKHESSRYLEHSGITNSEKWMIMRCNGMRNTLKYRKEYDQHRKLELVPPEKNEE